MKDYWDPEFKPSIQEIMDYRSYIMVIHSVGFLWRIHTLEDFPIFSLHMAGEGAHPGQSAQATHPNSV